MSGSFPACLQILVDPQLFHLMVNTCKFASYDFAGRKINQKVSPTSSGK